MFLRFWIVRLAIQFMLDFIYLCAFFVIVALAIPFARLRRDVLHAFTRNFWGRETPALDGRPVVWLHAVSVGEVLVCQAVLRHLQEFRPDLQFILSVGTAEGLSIARNEFQDTSVFSAPFDFSWAIRRTFDSIRPVALVVAENDFFPNMLNEAMIRDVPLAVFNTRMSPREQLEHRWNAWLLRPGLRRVKWWGAVTEADAQWIRSFFHVPEENLGITGSLKFDGVTRDPSRNSKTREIFRRFGFYDHDRVFVAGSTHPGEEAILIPIVKKLVLEFPALRVVIVPRNVCRCDDVSKLCQQHGVSVMRLSQVPEAARSDTFVTLVDSIGQLREVWGLAECCFAGGSLVRHGGQNMLEPASYGKPVCFGPHVWNFDAVVTELLAANAAVQVFSAIELESLLRLWLSNPSESRQLGERAQELIESRTEPLDRTIRGILTVLPEPSRTIPASEVTRSSTKHVLRIAEAS